MPVFQANLPPFRSLPSVGGDAQLSVAKTKTTNDPAYVLFVQTLNWRIFQGRHSDLSGQRVAGQEFPGPRYEPIVDGPPRVWFCQAVSQ